jgi:uncharacterized protein (DUF342 family)
VPEAAASTAPPLDHQEEQLLALAVRLNLIDGAQAAHASTLPSSGEGPVGARFVAAGLLTQPQIERLLATLAFKQERVADTRFGTLAVEHGWAKEEQIAEALQEQKHLFMDEGRAVLLGNLLVEHKVLTEAQAEALLLEQSRTRSAAGLVSTRVILTHDHMRATLVLHGSGEPPAFDQLRDLLVARGVLHGIDEETLRRVAAGEVSAHDGVVIATGTLPTAPQPGAIEYLFPTRLQASARERGEGRIDLRDHGDVPQVAAGTVIARATPPVPGEPGTNVLGQSIPPQKAKETPLKLGKGVELSADKLSASATVDGRPTLSITGVVSVYPEYEIKGDVDNSTGHVNFHGRVVVNGAVRAGFRVRCGELVAHEIEGAEIEAEGDVTVSGGIIRTHIRTGGALRARYLHQSTVEALGDIVIGREVVDSRIETSGKFESPECVVLASRISAKNGIQAREIGSETATPCHLIGGVDERVQNEGARLQAAIEEQTNAAAAIEKRMAAIAARNQAIAAEIGPLAQLQDRALVRLRELHKIPGAASATETAALRQQAHMVETRLNTLLAEQEQLRVQSEADAAALAGVRETEASLKSELAELKAWGEEHAGNFQIRCDLIHQQTLITGPHLEVRLETDRKAANLVEREKVERGHSIWNLVSV